MHSTPLDRRIVQGKLVGSGRPECVRTDPELQVELVAPSTWMTVTNLCATPVDLVSVTTRAGATSFAVGPVMATTMASGESVNVAITLSATAEAAQEDVLFVNTSAEGVAARYPVTMRVAPR